MNRELKFRIWDSSAKLFRNFLYVNIVDWVVSGQDKSNYFFQQFTGLKDKNGKDVYEGDIVKINRCYTRPFVNENKQIDYKFIDDGEVEVGQVLWGWNTQKYLVSYEHIRHDDIEGFDKSSHRVEVIGNIFENKELLK